jgi:hypothetical protein
MRIAILPLAESVRNERSCHLPASQDTLEEIGISRRLELREE